MFDTRGDGAALLRYTRESSPVPGGVCPWPPPPAVDGTACQSNCDCGFSNRCIGGHGPAGEVWACLNSCRDRRDCGPQEDCFQEAFGASQVCSFVPPCQASSDCGPGFECAPSGCHFVFGERGCTVNADCDPGFECTRYGCRWSGPYESPCLGDWDCPAWMSCIDDTGGSGLCATPCYDPHVAFGRECRDTDFCSMGLCRFGSSG